MEVMQMKIVVLKMPGFWEEYSGASLRLVEHFCAVNRTFYSHYQMAEPGCAR